MCDSRLAELTLAQIKLGLQKKQFSSYELTKAYLGQIKRLNGRLNIFLSISEQTALQEARASDKRRRQGRAISILDGVPLAVKDVICLKDSRTTAASHILENYLPPYDATVIKKLKQAGVVILGKTNLDAFAHGSSTENSDFGAVKNPWALDRVPGGSSGGSAAAVAAALAPLALGSDTGGSIRQPAAFCGISGFKPTYGAVSRFGLIAMASSLDQIGPMTTGADESREIMKIIAGQDTKDETSFNLEAEPRQRRDLKDLTFGVPKEYFTSQIDSDVRRRVEAAIELLKKEGAKIQSISLPHAEYALAVYYIIQPTEVASNLARYDGIQFGRRRDKFGAEAKRRIMLGTYVSSAGYADKYYLQAQKARTLIKEDFDKAFHQVDLLLAPTAPTPAFKLGEKTTDPLKMYLTDILTVSINLAGLPAISIPCGFVERDKKELPVGLQIIGPQKSDWSVLTAAENYQKLTDWHLKKPKI